MSISYNNDNIKPYYRKALSLIKEQKCAAASIVLNELKKRFSNEFAKNLIMEIESLLMVEQFKYYSLDSYNKDEQLVLEFLKDIIM